MKLWANLWILPQQEKIEKYRNLSVILIWLLGFIVIIRSLALLQFLIDLDYSEVNLVKLIQFTFVKLIILCFLMYFMRVLWTRPHRAALGALMGLCLVSLYQYRDLVSIFSSLTIGAIAFLLYLKLHVSRRELVAIEENPQVF